MVKEGTLVSLLDSAVEKFSGRTAVKSQITGENWTYEELHETSRRVAGYLIEKGVEKGDRVVIISDNNPGFIAANSGVLRTGAISVPIDQNLRPENLLADYLQLVQPRVILSDPKYALKIKKYTEAKIILTEEALQGAPKSSDIEIAKDDVSTIIFSSGTSSDSERAAKAVMLTHDNIVSNVLATQELPRYVEETRGEQGIYLAGLAKQWHSFENMIYQAFINAGGLMHFTDISSFMKGHAASINPHYVIMVPSVANSIMQKIKKDIAKKGKLVSGLFEWFLEQSGKCDYERVNNDNPLLREQIIDGFGDKLFYKKIREGLESKLGKNKPFLIGGSAKLPLKTMLFNSVISFLINQGYGLTETSPVISINVPWAYRFDSSGEVIDGTDVFIADPDLLKERKIKELPEGKSGVILVKGRNVFKGYYRDKERTKSVFIDGWFNTEDKGYMLKKFLHVEGRFKKQTRLSKGESVEEGPIESYYSTEGLNVIVVGEDCRKPGLLVVPDDEMLVAIKSGKQDSVISDVRRIVSDSQKRFGYNFSNSLAIVSDINEHPEWITGTMKFRGELIKKHYAETIKKICNAKST